MAKVALISSAGGHLTEVLAIAAELGGEHDLFLCVTDCPAVRDIRLDEVRRIYLAPVIWRHRHSRVFRRRQQQIGVLVTMVRWLVTFLRLFYHERPDFLITCGAEIAVPAFLVNRLLFRRPALFLESLARTETPSLTGRIASRLADRVFVQWPAVRASYGERAEYHGRLL
ncbi:MAG: hypothetical protein WBD75_10355 [Phycisphaerae bacterium]